MRWLGLVALLLVACAPRQQAAPTLGAGQVQALVGVFQPGLAARDISLRGARGQVVSANTEAAIASLVRQFGAQHPGFCPLQDEPFVSDDAQQRFMTVAARGREVRVLIYDRSPGSRINAVIGSGVAAQSLVVRRCAGG